MRVVGEEEVLDIQRAGERERIRRQLERILEHTSFRNSRRYQAFLRYVVQERLEGNAAHLKERLIGIAVFNQPLDYDTNANSVVRVTAGEVRRRLAQYYLNANLADEVMIELPIGSYVPEFRAHDSVVTPETSLAAPEVTFLYTTEEAVLPELTHALPAVQAPEKLRVSQRALFIALAACALLAIAAVLGFTLLPAHSNTTEADRIWKGAFDTRDVLLCAGPQGAEKQGAETHYANTGISYTITKTITIISSAVGRIGGSTFMLPMQDTKLEDLQRSPAVLLGAFNNEWTMRLQAPLRYQFIRTPEDARGIADTKNPATRFMIGDQPTRDYGLLAHFHSPTTGQSTMVIGGLGTHGTAAVRIFLSSPELLAEFSKTAPHDWQKRNYEIVLASDLVNNLADSPKVIAVEFW